MYCPVCQAPTLHPHDLEPGFHAQQCQRCEGNWIRAAAYWQWRSHGTLSPEYAQSPSVTPVDTAGLKWCPDCHNLLQRYQVGGALTFALDHCYQCGGAWLDKDEWAALKRDGLHEELYHIFTDAWQRERRETERQHLSEAQFRRRLGEKAFDHAREFKKWLEQQATRSEILAYLIHEAE